MKRKGVTISATTADVLMGVFGFKRVKDPDIGTYVALRVPKRKRRRK